MILTDAFYKLARPMMRGVKVSISNGHVSGFVKNKMVRDILGGLPQFVGEVVVGKPIDPTGHEATEEFLNDETLMFPFIYWVYDMRTVDPYPLRERLTMAEHMVFACHPCVQYVDHELVQSKEELDAYAKKVVEDNFFPGVVLREPFGTFGTEDEEIPAESLGLRVQ